MNFDSFYVDGTANSDGNCVEAIVRLPFNFNTSKERYSVSLVYCSFAPEWSQIDNLWMKYTDNQGDTDITIFRNVYASDAEAVLHSLKMQLQAKYGSDMRHSPIKIELADDTFVLKLRKSSTLEISDKLAGILGLETDYENASETTMMKIQGQSLNLDFVRPISQDVYYVTCDQLKNNCLSKNNRLLDMIHIPYADHNKLVQHRNSVLRYERLEDDNHLFCLRIRLLNSDGEKIFINSPQFFVLLHIRLENNENKLA